MIRPLALLALLPALAACADAAEEADQPVVDSEVVAPTTADSEELEPTDRSLADPAPGSVTRPGQGASAADDAFEAASGEAGAQ